MNDFARLERELMTRVRDANTPAAADKMRVRERLAANIALLSTAAAASSLPAADARSWRHLVNSHLASLGKVVAVTGAIAFGAGYLAGHRSQTVVTKIVTVTAPASKPQSPSAPLPADVGLTPAFLASASDWGRSGTRPKGAAKAVASAEIAAGSLLEELELLRRAERTIRSGNSQVALGLLRDLDERFPKGQLVEERAAARVMANCQLADTGAARTQGNAYLMAHPQSVYADRVRTLCQLDSTNPTKDSTSSGY
jgi:type IV secretory pathway VirB2 component (pilin)